MATFQTLSDRAMRLIVQIPSGSSGTSQETADNLIACNAMLDSWRNERLMCYALRDESITMVVSQTSYTVGSSGDLSTTRPVKILDAYIVYSNISYPVRILTPEEYDAVPDKTSTGSWPNAIVYYPTMTTGTVTVYPVPNAASYLHILTETPLTGFTAATDTVSLPPGWEEAIATNLAIAIAPEYETEANSTIRKMAAESKANIKRVNSRPSKAYTELPALLGARVGNIISGP
jgi:hypothetical protein